MRSIVIAVFLASTPTCANAQGPTWPRVGDCWKTATSEVVCLTPGPTNDGANWHLFTQSQGGTISLLHGLTRRACEFAMNRALGRPATDEEKERERKFQVARAERRTRELDECRKKNPLKTGETLNVCDAVGYGGSILGGSGSPGTITHAECFQ